MVGRGELTRDHVAMVGRGELTDNTIKTDRKRA
jgi:hypothetical protein